MDWLADTGSWASIASLPFTLVSFGISIYVAVRIRDVRQRLLFMVMADRRLGRLRKQIQALDEQMKGMPVDWIVVERLMRQICADIIRLRRSVSPETDKIVDGLIKLERRFENINQSGLRQREEEKIELVLKMLNEMMVFLSHSTDDVEDRRIGGSQDES